VDALEVEEEKEQHHAKAAERINERLEQRHRRDQVCRTLSNVTRNVHTKRAVITIMPIKASKAAVF
jgi:hypothetical protein